MANTITDGITTITPTLILGYTADTESRNVTHDIIGRASADVSLAEDSLRHGRLELLFATEAAAWVAHAVHRKASVLTLTVTDIPAAGMTYVREGGMTITLDPQTREAWTLTVGFQEVGA